MAQVNRILGIFAKQPRLGRVKTRLAAAIGQQAALRLYEAFLNDFLPRLDPLPVQPVVAYTPAEAQDYFRNVVPKRFQLVEQTGGDLGQRMSQFMDRHFDQGANQVVLVGSDTPDLPTQRIMQALDELDRRDVVLGPCDDGGYYLIGTSRPLPEIFQGIDWSTGAVFVQTVRRIGELALRLTVLEPWADIDRLDDLVKLSARLGLSKASGQQSSLAHTEAVLQSLIDEIN